MTTTNDQQLDQHVRDADIYHAEQQAFFEELDHQRWLDQMDAIHKPADLALDEAFSWAEQMHEEHGTWNQQVWAEEGF